MFSTTNHRPLSDILHWPPFKNYCTEVSLSWETTTFHVLYSVGGFFILKLHGNNVLCVSSMCASFVWKSSFFTLQWLRSVKQQWIFLVSLDTKQIRNLNLISKNDCISVPGTTVTHPLLATQFNDLYVI